MGFNNKYPYTDFHEMNLDWILEVVKRIETEWPEFKTTLENEWNEYKDELTGEGGEWPTFKTQIETTINNFIHDVVGDYNEDLDYKTGMFCYHEGTVYKCVQISSAAFPRPFNSYGWFSYSGQDLHSVLNDLFNTVTSAINNQNIDIASWIVRTAAQWDPTTPYTVGDYCSAHIGGGFNPFTWHYYKCIQDCTNVSVLDTNYWKEVIFASDVAETIAAYKQAMQDQYDQFLEDYQRTFGVVQVRGSSTTDVMSQKAVSDELATIDNTLNTIDGDIDTIDNTLDTIDNTLDDIESGQKVVGHAAVADNLTPYSEDSGTTQENPFISQGTGTDNNSVIVTTGNIARQLEKQGNTIAKNQKCYQGISNVPYGDGITNVSVQTDYVEVELTATSGYCALNAAFGSLIENHIGLGIIKVWCDNTIRVTPALPAATLMNSVSVPANTWSWAYSTGTIALSNPTLVIRFDSGTIGAKLRLSRTAGPDFIDLTQWFNGTANIPQDLLDNPSHFSWYYNGSLAYDAGSLQNCNGRYLECGQGRNLFAGNSTESAQYIGHYYIDSNSNYSKSANGSYNCYRILVTPNRPIMMSISDGSNLITYAIKRYVDKDFNLISGDTVGYSAKYAIVTPPAGTRYVEFSLSTNQQLTDVFDIQLYYSPEEGGEGYLDSNNTPIHYPYIAPIRIDTGNETLKAFDKKLPSGVITRDTGEYTFTGSESWIARGGTPDVDYYVCTLSLPDGGSVSENKTKGIASCNVLFGNGYSGGVANLIELDGYRAYISVARGISPNSILTSSVTIQYELGTPTTEQGTSFSEYADINDYSYMAWFDTDGNLVSIPQGCKLFYPVDYKGFIDDLVMYTNGDATALAKEEDITDSALNARGYLKLTALSGYDATKTQTLKNIQGVFTWVDDQ